MENERQIERQSDNRASLITIINWDQYQDTDRQNDQPVIGKRSTGEQQVITNKESKEVKNQKNLITKNVKVGATAPTLDQNTNMFFSNRDMQEKVEQAYIGREWSADIIHLEMLNFIAYWTEQGKDFKKRWQFEKAFNVRLRFWHFLRKTEEYNGNLGEDEIKTQIKFMENILFKKVGS